MKIEVKKLEGGQVQIRVPGTEQEIKIVLTKEQAKSLGDVLVAATKETT